MNLHAPCAGGREELDALFSSVANHERRQILETVYERAPDALTTRDLALELCDQEFVQETRVSLEHAHLPRLDDAGLVEWDSVCGFVRSANHDLLEETEILDITGQQFDSETLDDIFQALADHRRRTALSVLDQQSRQMDLDALATKVRIVEGVLGQETPSDRERIQTSLHHVHLPTLADAGLISYETDSRIVEYEGHPLLGEKRDSQSLVRSTTEV